MGIDSEISLDELVVRSNTATIQDNELSVLPGLTTQIDALNAAADGDQV